MVDPTQRPEPPDDDARVLHDADERVFDGAGAVGVEEHAHPDTVRWPCAASRLATSVPISPAQYTKVRKSIVCSARSMASNMAGKISSPFRRTSTVLPSVAGIPMMPSRWRRIRWTESVVGGSSSSGPCRPVPSGRRAGRVNVTMRRRPRRASAPTSGSDPATFSSSWGCAGSGPDRLELGGDRAAVEHGHGRQQGPHLEGDDAGQRAVGRTERLAHPEHQTHDQGDGEPQQRPTPPSRRPASVHPGCRRRGHRWKSKAVAAIEQQRDASGHRTMVQNWLSSWLWSASPTSKPKPMATKATLMSTPDGDGEQERQTVLVGRGTVLLDAVDAVQAPLELTHGGGRSHQRADEPEREGQVAPRDARGVGVVHRRREHLTGRSRDRVLDGADDASREPGVADRARPRRRCTIVPCTSTSDVMKANERAWLNPSANLIRRNASSSSRRRPVERRVRSASSPVSSQVSGTTVAVLIASSRRERQP